MNQPIQPCKINIMEHTKYFWIHSNDYLFVESTVFYKGQKSSFFGHKNRQNKLKKPKKEENLLKALSRTKENIYTYHPRIVKATGRIRACIPIPEHRV